MHVEPLVVKGGLNTFNEKGRLNTFNTTKLKTRTSISEEMGEYTRMTETMIPYIYRVGTVWSGCGRTMQTVPLSMNVWQKILGGSHIVLASVVGESATGHGIIN